MTTSATIIRELLNDSRRMTYPAELFGIRFPMCVKACAFDTASSLSEDYDGGLWHFYTLSNGAFYMAPDCPSSVHLVCDNGFEGDLSADAFGITVCLYAYSLLSFSASGEFGEQCAQRYHWLRDYSFLHVECGLIMAAIN